MNKILNKIVWLVIAAPLVYLAIIWNNLPERIVTSFSLDGNAERFGSKSELLIIMGVLTAVNIALYLLLSNAYRLDARKYGKENKDRMGRMAFAISVYMSGLAIYLIHNSLGDGKPFNVRIMFGSMGLIWCIMGNYMHTIKPNNFAGFRTKWTLNNNENWRKTHLLGGKLWFTGGLLVAISSFFTPLNIAIIVFTAMVVVSTFVPAIYSYRLHKKQKSLTVVN